MMSTCCNYFTGVRHRLNKCDQMFYWAGWAMFWVSGYLMCIAITSLVIYSDVPRLDKADVSNEEKLKLQDLHLHTVKTTGILFLVFGSLLIAAWCLIIVYIKWRLHKMAAPTHPTAVSAPHNIPSGTGSGAANGSNYLVPDVDDRPRSQTHVGDNPFGEEDVK